MNDSKIIYSKSTEFKFPSIFSLKVKPNAKKTEFLGFDSKINAYKLNVKEIADGNKANIAIIKFFKKEFAINVKIKSGNTFRHKIIEEIDK